MTIGKGTKPFIHVATAVGHLKWIIKSQESGFICIRIFTNGAVRKSRFFHNRDKDIEDQFKEFLTNSCTMGDHVFYSVNAFSEQRAKATRCVPGRLLHVDADGVSVPPPGPMPTRIVQSSPGNHHFFYELDETVSPDQAQALSRELTILVGGDIGGHSPAKLFRLPGILNEKY